MGTAKIDNDKTSLKLLHTGFKAHEKAKQCDEGWSHFLNELVKYCEKATTTTSLFLSSDFYAEFEQYTAATNKHGLKDCKF